MAGPNSSHPALSCTDSVAASASDVLMLAGRILMGWIFLSSGFAKLGNIAGTTGYFANMGLSPPGLFAWLGGGFEFLIGALLILGLATRYAALGTVVWVAVATWLAHRYWIYPAAQQGGQMIQFTKNLAIIGGALYVFVLGAGRFSVDAMLARR